MRRCGGVEVWRCGGCIGALLCVVHMVLMVRGRSLRVQDDAPHLQLDQQLVVPPKVLADTRGRVVTLFEGAAHQSADY